MLHVKCVAGVHVLVFSEERRVTHGRSLLAHAEGVCARLQPPASSYILLCHQDIYYSFPCIIYECMCFITKHKPKKQHL